MKELKLKGDHGSICEEIFDKVTDLELKCEAVKECVKEGYFSLHEALKIYNVTEKEYSNFTKK